MNFEIKWSCLVVLLLPIHATCLFILYYLKQIDLQGSSTSTWKICMRGKMTRGFQKCFASKETHTLISFSHQLFEAPLFNAFRKTSFPMLLF